MIYIRTDMNSIIATGHVMRCLAIADAARTLGEDTTFLLADAQAVNMIEKRGYHVKVLNSRWDNMDSELPILEALIETCRMKSILIDSYQVTPEYLSSLSALVKTFYIDDRNAFIYPVNALICYAAYWEKCNYPGNYPDTELHLGVQYTPLRETFAHFTKKKIKQKAENLLLLSGGSDPYAFLPKLLEKLETEAFKRVDVVCGIYNTEYGSMKKKYASYSNIYIHKAVSKIEYYMGQADLSVSAGGTTLYELCAAGTPTISYAMAGNQLDNVMAFQDQNVIEYAGDIRENTDAAIQRILCQISRYRDDTVLRAEKSEKMQSLVDGQGALRIARILCVLPLQG